MGVSVQSLLTAKEASADYKRNLHTIIHGSFHSEALPVVIVAGQTCLPSQNWRDLLVRSLQSRVEQNICFAMTRILVGCLLLRAYGSGLATTEGGQLSLAWSHKILPRPRYRIRG